MHLMHSGAEKTVTKTKYFENETETTKPEIYDDDQYQYQYHYADAKSNADATTYDPETDPDHGIGQANHCIDNEGYYDTETNYGIENRCYYASEGAQLHEQGRTHSISF